MNSTATDVISSNQTTTAVPPALVMAAGFQNRRNMGRCGEYAEWLGMRISFLENKNRHTSLLREKCRSTLQLACFSKACALPCLPGLEL
jgi:hypothetical protein